MPRRTPPEALARPNVRLSGEVNPDTLERFLDQVAKASPDEPLVVEITTQGGDADIGRRLAMEARLLIDRGREVLFLGKTAVYSAGITLMAAIPRANRWLTRDTLLLVHGRKLIKTIHIDGNLRAAEQTAQRLLAEAQTGIVAEDEGFAALAKGSKLTEAEVRERALCEWYLTAQEAVDQGLVEGLYGPTLPASRNGKGTGRTGAGGINRRR